MTNRFMPVFL